MDADGRALYVISVAAELAGMHPQTLRIYERKGLIEPARTSGRSRRYSERDIELLRRIHEGPRRFRCIAASVEPPEQLVGDLRLVQAAPSDDEGAVADHVAFRATTDREGTDPDLHREIPESREARRRLFERRRVLATFADQLPVPRRVALIAKPEGQPLGLDGERHRLPGHGFTVLPLAR